jgi:hypothetical protein
MVRYGKYSRTDCLIKIKEQSPMNGNNNNPPEITGCSVRHRYLTYYVPRGI